MQCGLLGRKLGHSYSPQIHSHFGSYAYDLFEKEPEELENFLHSDAFHGLNVTIPYKKAVIAYCDELSPTARRLGAVNTVVRRQDGTLFGHNTDYYGFQAMLERSGLSVQGKKVLVLGSGGASNTVCAVLAERGAQYTVISRQGENNYDNLSRHADARVIVNTTPVGMYPNTGVSPISLSLFPQLEGVLDVIYNPARTQLLLDAQARGLVTENGLWMLVAQAKESAEYFLGRSLDNTCIAAVHRELSRQMENRILIGMPGSGKSTVGKLLAQRLGMQFVDADQQIEQAAGMTIPEIFARDGEPGFRQLETQVLSQLGKQSGLVIATGGGCVTRPENKPLLRQNGRIIWLQRDLYKLPTQGRPLSQATSLEKMYTVRAPLYADFSDHVVDNNGSGKCTVDAIVKWEETL